MSLAFLTKPIGGSKKGAADPDPKEPKQGRTAKVTGPTRGGSAGVNVGGAPRVDLMPPEIRIKRSQLRTRRSLRLALFGVAVIVIVACGGAWAFNALGQTTLAAAQAQQQQLTAEQGTFADVTTVQSSTALIKAGQKVADSTDIDWTAYLNKLQATLPAGMEFSTVTMTAATPLSAYGQANTPLQESRIATLSFAATSPTLPSVPQLLEGLKTLPGFLDATPGNVTLTDGVYISNVTMHISTAAFTNRFDPAAAAAAKKAAAQSTDGGN